MVALKSISSLSNQMISIKLVERFSGDHFSGDHFSEDFLSDVFSQRTVFRGPFFGDFFPETHLNYTNWFYNI